MVNNLEALTDVEKCDELILFVNGGNTTATHKGKYVGYINKNKIVLHNVLFIPDFKRNFMSIENLS